MAIASRLSHNPRSWYTVSTPSSLAIVGEVGGLASEEYLAAVGRVEPAEQLDHGALPGPVVANEAEDLAFIDLEVDAAAGPADRRTTSRRRDTRAVVAAMAPGRPALEKTLHRHGTSLIDWPVISGSSLYRTNEGSS